jgi:hypothetical protein
MVSSHSSPKFRGYSFTSSLLVGEKIQLPPSIFDNNMLLGIILFYIKSVLVILASPGCWWLEGPAPHWFIDSSAQVPSEPRLGR